MNDEARVVIIGGGVGGTSIAYHLTALGWRDVVLLEKSELTHGTTFHSAGLVGQLRPTETLTRMNMHSVELYRRLKEETGVDPGWKEVGSLRLVSSRERMEELTRLVGRARTFGLPLELISSEEALELFPLFNPEGVLGAAYDPTDGYIDPSALTNALAEGARSRGVKIETGVQVTGITVENGRVTEVVTDRGAIRTEVVVNATGIWAPEIGKLAGVNVPLIPFQHQYVHVKTQEPVSPDFPTVRDPDDLVYFRPYEGDIITGGYGRRPAPFALDGVPPDFSHKLLDPDWDRFAPLFETSRRRVPAIEKGEVVELTNGPESFTPDGEFILGESHVRGFFVAAGFNAHGIAGAGGMGRLVAEWIIEGEPDMEVWEMDIRRFGDHYRSKNYTLARSTEALSTYYDIHFPNEERSSARNLRLSPAYERLRSLEAEFGEKAGWERPNYFRSNEDPTYEELRPAGWPGRLWSTAIPAEHLATRERAGLFDQTSFAKIEVYGPGACALLQRLCDNNVDRAVGTVTYTQMLNARGGIECDFTVTRLAENRFRIITGTAFGVHDMDWIRRHLPEDGSVQLGDVTSSLACVGIQGPRSREILSSVCGDDLSNEAFPYMRAREITVENVPCLALRVTYVGELGYELYPPTEFGARLWDILFEAGRPHGLVPAGYRAIESMRLEGGFLAWAADITPETNPYEAGLGFAVKLDKPVPFVGKEALEGARGVKRRLSALVLDDPATVALGNEPVRTGGGEVVSRVTSGGRGYSVGKSIAYAYLPAELAEAGTELSVEVFGEEVPTEVVSMPLWDPNHERVRG
ncbi:MAG TPA: FAD-dependent oxidoreductase [Rubrobacteraceae bacterium]|nr:FAD-dependent oxidoreductase [Rubrobacteraceae bacterium]